MNPMEERPVVEMLGISVVFPGVRALDDVDLRLFAGEVHALMGENGAGKSTLIKALTGAYDLEAGEILIDGAQHRVGSPAESRAAGIAPAYQDTYLAPNSQRRRERDARTRGPRPDGHQLARHPRARRRDARRTRAGGSRPSDQAVVPASGDPATRRHRQSHGRRPTRPGARRTDLEPGARGGRSALRRDAPAPRSRRRHPLRLALPRAGLCDQRPDRPCSATVAVEGEYLDPPDRSRRPHLEDDGEGHREPSGAGIPATGAPSRPVRPRGVSCNLTRKARRAGADRHRAASG